MSKVKAEIAPCQKIKTVKHKALQGSYFQILKTLASTIIDMLQAHLKIDIIKPCHGLY